MNTNCYISAYNEKAFKHFSSRGYVMRLGKKIPQLARDFFDHVEEDDLREYAIRIYYVDGFPSGRAFHKYMVKHHLLMNG